MVAVASTLAGLGGIAPTHELLQRGCTPAMLLTAVQRREVVRPRKGWYASPGLATDAIRAARVGGRLTCMSAAEHYNLWVPEYSGVHVEVPLNGSRLRTPDDRRVRLRDAEWSDAVVHWRAERSPGTRVVVSPAAAVRQTFSCRGDESGFVVLESALNTGILTAQERVELMDSLPRASRRLALSANEDSDSGGESELKLLLMKIGVRFRQQVFVGRWPVDFLIGAHLAVEADSRAHHSDPYRDRKKDAELSTLGVRVLRFMYSQIHFERESVEAAIVSAISRGDADFA